MYYPTFTPPDYPQMYAGAMLFGYFLRKVDRRFQLDRVLGFDKEDAV